MNGDDEDSFEMEAHLEEQGKTPPLSSRPEPDSKPQAQGGQEQEKPAEQQTSEPDPVLPEDLKGKFVPHGRFHELNERYKNTQQRYSALEQRTDKLLEIINQTLGRTPEQQQAQTEPKDEIPDPSDFVGRLDYVVNKVGGLEKLTKEQQQRQQVEQEGIALGKQVYNATQQEFAAAAQEDPTFPEAYNHLTNSRVRELMAVRGFSKQEAEATYQQEELELYHGALQRGERPSAIVKRLAEARGWTPKPAGQQQEEPKVDREHRREQHLSLTQMSGGQAVKPLTAKDLANMDEDSYARLSESVIKAARRTERAA